MVKLKKKNMAKKSKGRTMKECENSSCGKTQHDVSTDVEKQKKVKSKDVFVKKAKVPKGSHRMPDGSIMKDKDMKKPKKSY